MQARLQYYLLLGLLLLATSTAFAQNDGFNGTDPKKGPLKTGTPNLPPEEVRMMAEWEETEAILIAWSQDHEEILAQIAYHAAQECMVYVLAADIWSVYYYLDENNVDMDRIVMPGLGYNSIWIRDYGPWTVYQNRVDKRGISDFLYNRPLRTADDQIPYEVADYLDTPIFNADENPYKWTHTGGNFLCDGLGNAYSSDLVLRENSGKSGLELSNYANLFFGISDYRIVNRLRYDTIHHLDMHMRILDEETIAVGYYPEGVADGPWIEDNLAYIRNNYRTPFGKPYQIMRLEMPPRFGQYPPLGHYRTYTNSVFINKTILVPTYETAYDTTALRQYREYFPGYKVEGINCNDIIGELGALHCITKLVGVNEPLWIAHPRLRDTYLSGEILQVEAWAYHKTGINNAQLFYRQAGHVSYQNVEMQVDPTDLGRWTANIPPQLAGTKIEYYIQAEANNGKVQVRPQTAPEGFYPFQVKAWSVLPEADWVQRKTLVAPGSSVLFTNDSKNGYSALYWSFPGGEPTMSTEENVMVNYPESGIYNVRLVAVNPLGQDTLLREAAVEVREAFLPFNDTFDEGINLQWEVINNGSENVSWQWSAGVDCHEGHLKVPHQLAANKLNREFLRTAIDLRDYTQTSLTFDVAYAQRNSFHFDELRMNIVNQEGKHQNIYNKGGNILATTEGEITDFTPSSCNDWRTDTIDLSNWQGQQILFEIESIGDRGNSIYLDNIHFQANASPQAAIVYPTDEITFTGDGTPLQDVIRVEAHDPDGDIAKVDFFQGSNYIGTATESPYEINFLLPTWGYYQLQARATDNEDAEVWAPTITVNYDLENGLDTFDKLPVDVRLAPNPAEDVLQLRISSTANYWGMEFTITDNYGRILRQWSQDILSGKNSFPITVDQYPAGTYWLRLAHGKQDLLMRWVKGG